ncbi:MAG: 3-dehydroquinate synthase [Anaerolineae bacterium]|nr:3-dehydroquinate synthase [Anaerolineae bacterium]
MAIIQVSAPGGDYPIHIEAGLLQRVNEHIPAGRCVVVTNTTLAPLYGKALTEQLPDASLLIIPDGEQFKTLETVANLYVEFVRAGLDRSGTVIALGGGVVGDTVGFAAATYMRGVRFVQIPTTLLAMVDSSVGGKVGVDLPEGKNLVGAFKQPDKVLIDPDVLATLPARERRCGLAETLKHGLIADPGLLELAEQPDAAPGELVQRAVQVKVNIVQQDPYEKDIRAHLNLGHTFAHAIEQVSGYTWPHGEAVAVGLVAATRLSARLSLCDEELAKSVEQLLARVGLPTRIGALDPDALYAAMSTDKKWQSGQSRFILLHSIGQPVIVTGVEKSVVIDVMRGLQ